MMERICLCGHSLVHHVVRDGCAVCRPWRYSGVDCDCRGFLDAPAEAESQTPAELVCVDPGATGEASRCSEQWHLGLVKGDLAKLFDETIYIGLCQGEEIRKCRRCGVTILRPVVYPW